ncbi:MFS transporter [Actinomadura madurae]|uniref:MFS transporter n=1 Tax=Actinomadura madurae TaxID=1993 RepID=UPI0020D20B05|nr:MFS transporter [Actinomadura madurae]MCP9967498.1 MFS transporter [Actinomadura madurae]
MSWFSVGGNVGFALAPLLVAAVIAPHDLRFTPFLAVPALVGSVLCLPVLRALETSTPGGSGPSAQQGVDDRRSFVKLSLAVVCRSVVFMGMATFISFYARQRTGGGMAAGTAALFVLYLGGAVGTVLGGSLAARWDRVTAVRRSYLVTAAAVAGIVFVPGPAIYLFIALTSAGLYIPFSLQVTLGQDYLPTRVGTASGVTLGLTVSIGGLAAPVLGSVADATSLRTALTPLIAMPALAWLLIRTLPEPALPAPAAPAPRAAEDVAPGR